MLYKRIIRLIVFSAILLLFSSMHAVAEVGSDVDCLTSPTPEYYAVKKIRKDTMHVYLRNEDVAYYTRGANGLIVMPLSDWEPFPYNVRFRDTVIYNPAYLPVVFDGKILPPNLDFRRKDSVQYKDTKLRLIPREETFVPLIEKTQEVESSRRNFYLNINNMGNVRYSTSSLRNIPKFSTEEVTKRNILHDLITADDPIKIGPMELPKAAPTFIYWLKNGEHSLQVAQNFISENWHKGGNSSFFVRNYHKLTVNYKKDKLSFDNVFEWKLHLQQTPADNEHNINISEDLVRLENTLSYKAYNNWSYSAKLETKTQLFDSYPINSKEKNMALLSPLTVNVGVGMKYTLEKKYKTDKAKKLKFSQNLAPFSLNLTYLNDTTVTKRSGVEMGKSSKIEFGSLINTDVTFNFNRYMTWTSRLKYFTNYQRSEFEFENKFDMSLNRFLSTSIYLYARFDDDDGAAREKNLGYFQVNELISFGLTYKW